MSGAFTIAAGMIWAIEPDPNAHAAMMLNAEANGVTIASWTEPTLPEVDLILAGEITSIQVRHNMFPAVDMVAFPKRDDDQE